MSKNDPLLRFHQHELDGLKKLRIYAIAVCKQLHRLFEAIRDDKPLLAAWPIREFLGPLNSPLCQCLEKTGHLIQPVAIPTEFPFHSDEVRTPDGHRVPTLTAIRTANSAHEAAERASGVFQFYLESKVFNRCSHLGLGFKPDEASDELVENHWQEICSELGPVCEFDVDALAKAIEKEHRLAIERCRDSVLTSAVGKTDEDGHPEFFAGSKAGAQGGGNTDAFVYAPEGDGYFISGFGEKGHITKLKGFDYILTMLLQPERTYSAIELHKPHNVGTSRLDIADEQALRECKARLATAKEDCEKAEKAGDTARVYDATEETEAIERYIRQSQGLGDNLREMSNFSASARTSVHKAIERAIEKLRNTDPPMLRLAAHFERSIQTGSDFSYHPEGESPAWNFSLPENN